MLVKLLSILLNVTRAQEVRIPDIFFTNQRIRAAGNEVDLMFNFGTPCGKIKVLRGLLLAVRPAH